MKKRVFSIILALCIAFGVLSLTGCGKTTLNVYNWGEYIDPEVLAEFKKETGIKVNYTTYDNNEAMYSKISSGAANYDVIVPSDYMIGKLIEEDMLAELDFDNIPNYKYIGEDYKGLAYDPENKYSVPYSWGTTIIMYNKKMVDPADVADKSIDLLWNPKYKNQILMFNNPRDAFALAQTKLGYSFNSTNPDEWKEAAELLKQQRPLVQAYVMDQVFDKMENNEAAIATYYAGDALIIHNENEDVESYIPKEGANLFVDAMCVLKTSQHKAEAEAFINFMLKTDVAVRTAEVIGYATPHTEAKKLLDTEFSDNPLIYPDAATLENTEVFLNLPQDIGKLQSDLWMEIKSSD